MSGAESELKTSPANNTLLGLGSVSRSWLADMGFHTANDLQSVDVFDLYRQLKQRHSEVNRNLLYALIGAQENRDWREVSRTDKTSILLRLEQMGLLQER
ncbi:MAG: transcriptional regulator [Rhizobacter sp.]